MYIRNDQRVDISSAAALDGAKQVKDFPDAIRHSKANSASDISTASDTADISDISELRPAVSQVADAEELSERLNLPVNSDKSNLKKSRADRKNTRTSEHAENIKVNGFTEYLYNRKYFILLFSVIYIVGLIIGAILIKNVGGTEIINLRSTVDSYYADADSANIVKQIINSIAVNGIILFVVYLAGVTVFCPLVCSALCLYKGLSCGYIIGIYIVGGADWFHVTVCCLTFVFYLFMMLCLFLACSEAMRFSSFLLKSEGSIRKSLSFENIAVYSSRYILFLVLTVLFTMAQTIVISTIYATYFSF